MSPTTSIVFIVISIVFYYYYYYQLFSQDDCIVEIETGKLRGSFLADLNGEKFYAFQNIPFAKPPIGKLRFQRAQPADAWSGVREATEPTPKCIQRKNRILKGQEDCLYLNVYTKSLDEPLKPVIFYIHGGLFLMNSAHWDELNPQNYMIEDVVIVTANYRLGILGFYALDGIVESNLGMKDQVLALQWTYDKIQHFGGDPSRITLVGNSAGGTSVFFHLLSPLSKGLFHQAIIQSPKPVYNIGRNRSAAFIAEKLDLNVNDTFDFLMNANYFDIFLMQERIDWSKVILFDETVFHPIIEGPGAHSFMPDHPMNIIKSGNYSNVPLLIGTTDSEAEIFQLIFTPEQYAIEMPLHANFPFGEQFRARIKHMYFSNTTNDNNINVSYITDIGFRYETYHLAVTHSRTNRVYCYEFGLDTKMNHIKALAPHLRYVKGALHADEVGYFFVNYYESPPIVPNSLEDVYVRRMVRLWSNFVKYGHPTAHKDELLQNIHWPSFTSNDMNILNILHDLSVTKLDDTLFTTFDDVFDDYYKNIVRI